MMGDDASVFDALEVYDTQVSSGRAKGPGRYTQRTGHSSILWMIRYELGQPSDPENPKSPTNLQMVARRLVGLAVHGKEDVALRAAQLLLAYFEGEPRRLVQFEIVQAAKDIAEMENCDPQALIDEAERIVARAGLEG